MSGVSEPLDLRAFESAVLEVVDRHALASPGDYARWSLAAAEDRASNPYGAADAANLLYTLDRLPGDPGLRAASIEVLRGFRDPEDGLFRESTHHPIHTTAHCLAALELFDAVETQPIPGLAQWLDTTAMRQLLESLDWASNPWLESHRGAGLYAALHLARQTTAAWEDAYFDWLHAATDPATGLVRGEAIGTGQRRDWFLFPALAGTFHYLFDELHARRPHAHAAALVDTCLEIRQRQLFPLATSVGFAEIDWVYCLNRASLQSGVRLPEARAALLAFAREYLEFLLGLDPATDPGLDDLHALFGAVCAVAELQRALPGVIVTERPWRLVLDRRPFI